MVTGWSADVVVLGMGTCGEDAALRLARAGLDVVGVEENLIGGECPYWACLPTKSLVRSAGLLAEARRADGLVGHTEVVPDWTVVAARLRSEITGGWDDAGGVARFTAAGGRFLRGHGVLAGPRTVRVGDTEVTARTGVVLATGSRPAVPPVPGLDEVPAWTTHEVVEAEVLPPSLVVLGGGAVGCELSQVLARFGVAVTVVEAREHVLPEEEPDAASVVSEALARDGVSVRAGVPVASVTRTGEGVSVHLADGSSVVAERLLVATGRVADADGLGVTAAGARTDRGFVVVDPLLRAADGLWAIGDVTGHGLLTEVALHQGRTAVEDVLGAGPVPADAAPVPRAVFTDPEVGAVGLTEAAARAAGHEVRVLRKDLRATFRGWLHRIGNEGVVVLVQDVATGRLLGATTVGPRASEVLGFLTLAVHTGVTVDELSRMVYAFPTFWGAVGEAVGAYGRGIVRVLDPGTPPLVDDPPRRT
jgi:pyruvate/2-oxoglutarate dehydrogenase complex dihydrolipoamide dehydrogenase (E3) component